jgi:hypothetical protein
MEELGETPCVGGGGTAALAFWRGDTIEAFHTLEGGIPMSLILLVVVLVLLFGGGGGYYGYRRWGTGGGIGIVGLVLIILVVLYLFGGLSGSGLPR